MTRILAVDDDVESRALLEAILRGAGFEVALAANGADALRLAVETPPDLVVTDALMPVMDGFELTRRLKAEPLLRRVPIVFYTSQFGDTESEELALSLGAARFAVKPLKSDELLGILGQVLAEATEGSVSSGDAPGEGALDVLRRHHERVIQKLEQGQTALKAERDSLQVLLDAAPVELIVVDEDLNVVHANQSAKDRLARNGLDGGRRCGDFVGCARRLDEGRGCGSGPQCDACPVRGAILRAFAGEGSRGLTVEIEAGGVAPGERGRLVFSCNVEPLTFGGRACSVVGFADVTASRRDAARIEHLNSMLRGIHGVSQLITRETDRDSLIQQACEALVACGGFHSAVVGIVRGAEDRVEACAGAGGTWRVPGLRQELSGGDMPGCARDALRACGTVVRGSPDGVCAGCPGGETALEHGRRLTVALSHGGGVEGFLIASPEEGVEDDPDCLRLLRETAADLGYALHGLKETAARREIERRYRRAEEIGRLGHWTLDPVTLDFRGSPMAASLFGLEDGAVLSYDGFLSVVSEADRGRVAASLRRLVEDGVPYDEECEILPVGSSEPRIVWSLAELVRAEAGGSATVDGIVQDVTVRRRAEAGLRVSEERFKLSMEATNDGLWDWNSVTNQVYYSPACYRMLGYEVDAFPGTLEAWQKLLHPDDVERTMNVNMDCVEGRRETFSVEYRLRAKDGGWRWILGRGKAITRDARGRAVRLVGTNSDITERKRVEQELQDRLRLETLVADLAATFVGRVGEGLDSEIGDALARIADCLDFDTGAVWQPSDDGRDTVVLTHLYRRAEGPPVPLNLDALDCFPFVLERLKITRTTVIVRGLADLPPEAVVDRESYETLGVRNSLNVPLFSADGGLSGVLAFNGASGYSFNPLLVGRVEMIGRILLTLLAQQRNERALSAGRERMRILNEMLDEAPAGILVHDEAGRVLYANRYSIGLHGYEAAEFGRLKLSDMVAPALDAGTEGRIAAILGGRECAFEAWHVRKDGSSVLLHVVARRVMWLGQPAVLSVQADVTERRRFERSEEMRALRAQAMVELLERGADTEAELMRTALESLASITGSKLAFLGTVDESEASMLSFVWPPRAMEDCRVEGKPVVFDVTKGGLWAEAVRRRVPVLVNDYAGDDSRLRGLPPGHLPMSRFLGVPLVRSGRVVIVAGLGNKDEDFDAADVTEVGTFLEGLWGRLSVARAEAERERLEEQLRMAQKMEAIGSLAGGVAHDFNNLLSVILSYTGFVLEEVSENQAAVADLLEVERAAERAVALTRQLLAFSRKQVLQPVLLDLNAVAAGVEKMLVRIVGEDVSMVQRRAPDLGLTVADPGQVEQILMNLVINARDAMPRGGRLTIETGNVEVTGACETSTGMVLPGSYVQVVVSDTGHGMDEETRSRVFEPFFTTKEVGKGTGLGLSTVYGIARQSGGGVAVASEPGKGSTFRVLLPRASQDATGAVPGPAMESGVVRGTETILVVEDQEALRKLARRALEGAGYRVLIAGDGDEALAIAAAYDSDLPLLLTDVVMPGMNGPALAERLSALRPALRTIFMSGYADAEVLRQGVLAVGAHFLAKPFTVSELTRKVRQVLDGDVSKG